MCGLVYGSVIDPGNNPVISVVSLAMPEVDFSLTSVIHNSPASLKPEAARETNF